LLTGNPDSIKRVTDAAGFRYAWDEQTAQFAHASGVMIATPEGKLARYFYGIEYAPVDLKLGIVEASQNKIGSPIDSLLLYCFHYDPAAGSYRSRITMGIMRGGGVAFLAGLESYGTDTRRPGEYRIPIDRAKDLLLERNQLGSRQAGAAGVATEMESVRFAEGYDIAPTQQSAAQRSERRGQ
jgi:hypothetical protein